VLAVTAILDQLLAPVPGGVARYAEEIVAAMCAEPDRPGVGGLVARASATQRRAVASRIPGLAGVDSLPLPRPILSRAWAAGYTVGAPIGPVYAPSLLAPLSGRRSRSGRRTVVTLHDTVPWTHPELLTPHGAAWHRTMAARALRYADAIAVTTQAVADECVEIFGPSDRFAVVPGAVGPRLSAPSDADADAAARRLGLPDRYIVAVGTLEPRKGIHHIVAALSDLPDLHLVVVGPGGWGGVDIDTLVMREGVDPNRVTALGRISDSDVAVAISRALALVYPSAAEGFGLPVLEAMALGTPVVHSDAPALVEVAGGAGLVVPRGEGAAFAQAIGAAVGVIAREPATAARLSAAGLSRAREFSWARSAAAVWALLDS
jgi:glycosyltransferase involved in cell wall biosynthesis